MATARLFVRTNTHLEGAGSRCALWTQLCVSRGLGFRAVVRGGRFGSVALKGLGDCLPAGVGRLHPEPRVFLLDPRMRGAIRRSV